MKYKAIPSKDLAAIQLESLTGVGHVVALIPTKFKSMMNYQFLLEQLVGFYGMSTLEIFSTYHIEDLLL